MTTPRDPAADPQPPRHPGDPAPPPPSMPPAPPHAARAPGGCASRTLLVVLLLLLLAAMAAVWALRSGGSALGRLLGGEERTLVTHDVVVDRVRSVAKLVSSEATVRDVVTFESTRYGSTKRSLVVVTGRLLAGVELGTDASGATVGIDHEARRIDIALPPATLLAVEVVSMRTYDERAGLWNPFTTEDRDAIQQQVRLQLERAGNETGLLERADRSAAALLEAMLARDGYTVNVTRRSPPIVAPAG